MRRLEQRRLLGQLLRIELRTQDADEQELK